LAARTKERIAPRLRNLEDGVGRVIVAVVAGCFVFCVGIYTTNQTLSGVLLPTELVVYGAFALQVAFLVAYGAGMSLALTHRAGYQV